MSLRKCQTVFLAVNLLAVVLGAGAAEEGTLTSEALNSKKWPWPSVGQGAPCEALTMEAALLSTRQDVVEFLIDKAPVYASCTGVQKTKEKSQGDAALFALMASQVHHTSGKNVLTSSSGFDYLALERPNGWSYSGPFVFGKTEQDGDPLSSLAGGNSSFSEEARLHSLFSLLQPHLGKQVSGKLKKLLFAYPSEVVSKGIVDGWKSMKSTASPSKSQRRLGRSGGDGGRKVDLNADHGHLQGMIQELGGMSIMEFVGYCYTEYAVLGEEGATFILESTGLHSVFYSLEEFGGNQKPEGRREMKVLPVAADLYRRHGRFSFTVNSPGLLRVYVRLRGQARAQSSLTLTAVSPSSFHWDLQNPLFEPDVVGGTFFGPLTTKDARVAWLPIPVILHAAPDAGQASVLSLSLGAGTPPVLCLGLEDCGHVEVNEATGRNALPSRLASNAPLTDPEFSFFLNSTYQEGARSGRSVLDFTTGPLTLGHKLVLPVMVGLKETASCSGGHFKFLLDFTLVNGGKKEKKQLRVNLRCRDFETETFLATAPAQDNSIISFGVRAPISECTTSCPIVLSQHGTGVTAGSQADSFKQGNGKGGYTFGVEGAWVVTPDRHGAHNWETVGRLAALSSLFQTSLVTTSGFWGFWADKDRVIYTGHSMGGHGALHLAVLSPERAIGCIFLAGWLSKEHYGDANAIFKLDRGTSYTSGPLKGVLEASVLDNVPDSMLRHLVHLPVLVRVGENDKTVSSYYSRRLVRMLKEAGHVNVQYDEVSGKEHWWWDTLEANDGGCMNDRTVRRFLKKVIYGNAGSEQAIAAPVKPSTTATLQSMSPTTVSCRFGVCITGQVVPQTLSTVVVDASEKGDAEETESWSLKTTNVERVRLVSPAIWSEQGYASLSRQSSISAAAGGVSVDAGNGGAKALRLTLDGAHGEKKNSFVFQWSLGSNENVGQLHDANVVRPGDSLCREKTSTRAVRWAKCATHFPLGQVAPGAMRSYTEGSRFTVQIGSDSYQRTLAVYLANLQVVAYDSTIFASSPSSSSSTDGPTLEVQVSPTALMGLLPPDSQEGGPQNLAAARVKPQGGGLQLLATSTKAMEHLLYDVGQPTVPPMMRPPFTNLLPGLILSDPSKRHMGTGSLILAAFFDSWEADQVSSQMCYSDDGGEMCSSLRGNVK